MYTLFGTLFTIMAMPYVFIGVAIVALIVGIFGKR